MLHGDLGARARGGNHPQKTGDRAEPYIVKDEQMQWGLASGVSLYPVTTKEDDYVPDLISIARGRDEAGRQSSVGGKT